MISSLKHIEVKSKTPLIGSVLDLLNKSDIKWIDMSKFANLTEISKFLLSLDGFFTSYNPIDKKYSNRYLKYSKDPIEVKRIIKSLLLFIYKIKDSILDNFSDSRLGYISNNACINLRIESSSSKQELYNSFESIFNSVFQDSKISITKDANGFRIVRKKRTPTFDPKTGKTKKYTVLLVIVVITNTMDAFVKEQEIAEDLYLYKDPNIDTFHFKNTKALLDRLKFDYSSDRIHLLKESNKRIEHINPFNEGKFNFIKYENFGIGKILADIGLYNNSNYPTYISIKSFGNNLTDKVHLISLKLDYPCIYTKEDFAIGTYVYHLLGNKCSETADIYEENKSDIKSIYEYILSIDKSESKNSLYLERYKSLFNGLSYDQKLNSITKFLTCPLFTYWSINPFLFIRTFQSYEQKFNIEEKEYLIDKSKDTKAIECFEHLIKEAFGNGYILFAIKDRYIYAKDYRQFTISEQDNKILKYEIYYPVNTRKAIELRLKTETLTIIGEIYSDRSIIPNRLSFFYYYNNFSSFFKESGLSENKILNEGFLLDSGFNRKRPEFDRLEGGKT